MSETIVKFENKGAKKKSEVPLTLDWGNAKMVRVHSIRAACKEVLNMSKGLDVVKINIIGNPSTGKTTCASLISHLLHKMADIPYTVKNFSREDLLDFENTLSKLKPVNHIITFDDISFLTATASGKQIKKIEKAFTEIRHLPGGQDIKIIAIFNFHYNMAVSKYMRQSDVFIYTSIGSSELENTQNVVGKKYTHQIMNFKKYFQQAITTEKFTIILGNKGQKFVYKYKQPFIPLLWFNGISARLVVSPKREWVDPYCTTCANASSKSVKEEINLDEFKKKIESQFGRSIVKQALRFKLMMLGVSTYSKRTKNCMRVIDEWLDNKDFDAELLADIFEIRDIPTTISELPHGADLSSDRYKK